MIDLHCHVLPGIDDGPGTMDRSVALVRAASDAGMRTIVATPHVSARYPNDAQTIAELVDRLNVRLRDEQVPVEVLPGAELALVHIVDLDRNRLGELSLGGGPWLLIEFPFSATGGLLELGVVDLMKRGHRVVIAHPERCAIFHRDRAPLRSLVQEGALTSITADSLVGRFGQTAKRVALELLGEELVHNVASDAHDPLDRAPGVITQLAQAGFEPLAEWLTGAVPAAIIAGAEQIPPRPAFEPTVSPPGRRRRWLPLGR